MGVGQCAALVGRVAGVVETILTGILSAAFGGAITGVAAVAAVRIEIKWLTMTASRQEQAILRAHQREDMLEARLTRLEAVFA